MDSRWIRTRLIGAIRLSRIVYRRDGPIGSFANSMTADSFDDKPRIRIPLRLYETRFHLFVRTHVRKTALESEPTPFPVQLRFRLRVIEKFKSCKPWQARGITPALSSSILTLPTRRAEAFLRGDYVTFLERRNVTLHTQAREKTWSTCAARACERWQSSGSTIITRGRMSD